VERLADPRGGASIAGWQRLACRNFGRVY
jgi:hypothetical protein